MENYKYRMIGLAALLIAEKLADLSSYFLIVLCAIYLEKYLLTILGYAAFRILIPIACILFGINLFIKNESVKKLAAKFVIFGIAIFLIIPVSIRISSMIEDTYASSIESTLSEADETVSEIEDLTGWDKAQSFFDDAADKTSGTLNEVSTALDGAFSNISNALNGELLEKAQEVLNHFLEAVAVMIITSCVIPILVLVFFVWITKMVLEVDIHLPAFRQKK